MKSAASLLVALAFTASLGAQNASQLVNLRHWSGQAVAPVYEGFDINPDGSFNMWFGYMNRNYEEEIDLPVGAGQHASSRAATAASRRTSCRAGTRTSSA